MSLDSEDRLVQIPSLIDNDNIQISKNTDSNKLKIPVFRFVQIISQNSTGRPLFD